jgi:3-deoxy-D-manno-octulosonate 8-phosphate phosphatase (KDO 8-P phosphatase)
VKILLCDVDGVLTDGTVLIGDGRELKGFHIQDGLGLQLLHHEGVKTGWVSNRPSSVTKQRADELKIDFLYQDKGSKVEACGNHSGPGGVNLAGCVFYWR